ncbi:replication initiator [Streptomyces sp. NPDC055749]
MLRTCWELGKLPEFAHLKLRKLAHMLSFRGHFSTKSLSYSSTLGALRHARRTWHTEQPRTHASLPDLNPTTTLVVGYWDYLGSGYSPGTALLAAAVWHHEQPERQFAAEGAPHDRAWPGADYAGGTAHRAPGNGPLQLGRSAGYDILRTRRPASITLGRARRIPAHALTDFIRTRLDQEAA